MSEASESRVTAPEALRRALGQVIADQRKLWRDERSAMEREMREAVEAHRERIGRLPQIEPWSAGIHRTSVLVTHGGSLWQAQRDTAEPPPHADWLCIVAGGANGRDGRGMTVCGTWQSGTTYRHLDLVALGGSSFVARRDDPGPCPGDGWQLIASAGKRQRPAGRSGVVAAAVDDTGLLTLRNADGTEVHVDLVPLLAAIAQVRKS